LQANARWEYVHFFFFLHFSNKNPPYWRYLDRSTSHILLRSFINLEKEFAAKVPKLEFSPAKITSLLLANKQSPRQAIDNVDAWIEKVREERKKLKRADSWVLNDIP
jgi:hypothetical protein